MLTNTYLGSILCALRSDVRAHMEIKSPTSRPIVYLRVVLVQSASSPAIRPWVHNHVTKVVSLLKSRVPKTSRTLFIAYKGNIFSHQGPWAWWSFPHHLICQEQSPKSSSIFGIPSRLIIRRFCSSSRHPEHGTTVLLNKQIL